MEIPRIGNIEDILLDQKTFSNAREETKNSTEILLLIYK